MTDYAQDPRADVNQDGVVDAADLLAIRNPANWQKKIRPEGVPEMSVISYAGSDPDACAMDVRTAGMQIYEHLIRSTAHAIVASKYWENRGLEISSCEIESEGYGIYSECDNLRVEDTVITARNRDPIRIAGGAWMEFFNVTIRPTLSAASWRIHSDARQIAIRNCTIEGCNPWGLDIGEQYRGAGGIVRDVLLEDCTFIASPQTMYGVRVRGQGVRLVRCKGIGFAQAQPGAALVTFERHSCDPIGGVVEGCSCDGRPVVRNKWHDTVVR